MVALLQESLKKAIDSTEETIMKSESAPGRNRIAEYYDLTKKALLDNSDAILTDLSKQAA